MQLKVQNLSELAQGLIVERKRQGLSREQAAAVCNVSESFIRDAESDPGRCSLTKLLQLTQGLGLTLTLTGWQIGGTTSDSHPNTKVSTS
ncbi:helix-turn-helix domain-containing protein [Polaromonas sp. JS666]|uniref:helix-turn-helix domain-containing protein n=1 Tax=Polaromonas sp. (strain JS666 / ATCC BAA-500) TaxID=296591 RepID=UPI0000534E02|nr:helix-turn-helix domain-containing protein [Polaromonas sp. JS666]ABE42575.1 transcriptional regulator, XRE family [Polaromonas sp. JS666]